MTSDSERWASIPDAHDYLVSDEGNIRRMLPDGRWRPIKVCRNTKPGGARGYLKVNLGRGRQEYVHRLILWAFVGICPDDHEADHIDHDRANNSLINLRYRLASENHADNNGWQEHPSWAEWDRDAGREGAA